MHPDALDSTRFRFVDEVTELSPGVFVFPRLAIADEEDTHFEHFFTLAGGNKQADTFTDELALVLKQGDEVSVLSACSHRGNYEHHPCSAGIFSADLVETGIGWFSYPQYCKREI